jgi:hypothetical protein
MPGPKFAVVGDKVTFYCNGAAWISGTLIAEYNRGEWVVMEENGSIVHIKDYNFMRVTSRKLIDQGPERIMCSSKPDLPPPTELPPV